MDTLRVWRSGDHGATETPAALVARLRGLLDQEHDNEKAGQEVSRALRTEHGTNSLPQAKPPKPRHAFNGADARVEVAEMACDKFAQQAKPAESILGALQSELDEARGENAELKAQVEKLLLERQAGSSMTQRINPDFAAALETGPPDEWEEDSLLCVWCCQWRQLPQGEESANYVGNGEVWSCRMPPLRTPCRNRDGEMQPAFPIPGGQS